MNNEFLQETMKLEGQRFLLLKQMDQMQKKDEYPHLTHRLNVLTEKIEQYHLVIKAFKELNKRKKL